jgi:ribosome-binding factor A
MSQRTDRLNSQIQQELMVLLQRELKDPRVGFATVTRVETARDLGSVRAWVSIYGEPETQAAAMEALEAATPWLRRRLGERLQLRAVPVLSLRRDESIEEGDRVLRLLRELEQERSDHAETGG